MRSEPGDVADKKQIRLIHALPSLMLSENARSNRPPVPELEFTSTMVSLSERRKTGFRRDLPARRSPPRQDIAMTPARRRDEPDAPLPRPDCPYTDPDAASFSSAASSPGPGTTGSALAAEDREARPILHAQARAVRNEAPVARTRPFARTRGNESRSIRSG